MNSCPNCKTDNEPDAQFCTVCGSALSAQDIPVGESFTSSINTIKKNGNNQKRIFIFCSIFVLLLGITNIGLWFFLDYRDRILFLHYFGELNLFFWIVLNGKLIFGILLIVVGILGVFLLYPKLLASGAVCLLLSGIWDIGSDFLAIPALEQYNHYINFKMVLHDLSIVYIIFGILQISLAFYLLSNFNKIRSFN